MIPKKKRRVVIVDEVEYEYSITGCVNIFIKNIKTGNMFSQYYDWKPKWKSQVTPLMIVELIRENKV